MIGQVIDPSGLDAVLDPQRYASHWLFSAYEASTPLYVPTLALTEVRALLAVRLERLAALYELLEHPSIVRRDLDLSAANKVAELLAATGRFDVCAAHVIVVARERGWPVITADAGRLRRIDPEIDVLLA